MIGSETRLVAIIGSPISQVKSPDNFNRYFADEGADRAMIAIDLLPDRVADFVSTVRGWQNLDGFVVTIPHKGAVAGLVDELSATAQFLGVANVVRRHADGRLSGDMTDGEGFLKASETHGFEPAGKTILMVGAGAAGSAIGYALATAGVSHLAISDRHEDRAANLAARLATAFPAVTVSGGAMPQHGFDLVVNASSSGMHPDDPLPVPDSILSMMPSHGLVADVVTSPDITPLLMLARRRGLKIQTGKEMAKAQLFALAKAMGLIEEGSSDV
ncbi:MULTISPECIES: shikimate dehydrogenase family protein [Agrobacterium]|uniref:shikimate dehydrogenase (NADP(+)) n=1 Tax=Agrobacterium rosae TaxID=1972867 RepID=A0A1R3TJQ1_9HYPH|nr:MULTISPECIES: shikimate dehydrogenase [Agrobacterium]SCX08843.1 Shikimate dehydrogenase [Agrobacterium rosae]SCX18804.1 Shikimate dehydrogenase [Agrobacterium sp. DSM 25558]